MKCPYCHKEFTARDAKIRSTPENRYYWGIVIELVSEELGHTKDETHELLKSMFLKEMHHLKLPNEKIKEITIIKSTAELTTVEFEEYMSSCRTWASLELELWIPEPNEVTNE